MTATDPKVVRSITAADIDAQGNVVIWDHGPQPPKDIASDDPRYAAAAAEAKAWHEKNGDGPMPLNMHQGDAAHAMQVEPERYALDPIDLDDSEVAAEVKRIQDEREAAKKVVEERAAALQLAADRKAAAVTVLAARQAKAVVDKASAKPATRPSAPETGLQTAARIAEKRANDMKAQYELVLADKNSTPEQVDRARAASDDARRLANEASARVTTGGG